MTIGNAAAHIGRLTGHRLLSLSELWRQHCPVPINERVRGGGKSGAICGCRWRWALDERCQVR